MMIEKAAVSPAEKLEFLANPASWPERPASVEVIETHMSWVFLVEFSAYKLKKPVSLPFLDYSTLAARKRHCRAEVTLNQRLARDAYLGVETLVRRPGGQLCISGRGQIVDYLIHMRRLPADRMLDRMIAAGPPAPQTIQPAADLLARFYRHATPIHLSSGFYHERLRGDVESNCDALLDPAYRLPAPQVEAVRRLQLAFLEQNRGLLAERSSHHIVEAHGDLRPEHICLTQPPLIIDCLEFSRDFRLLDPADELAFLKLECEMAGAPRVADVFVDTYTRELGDHPPAALFAFYQSCRACLRAKLSLWHLKDDPHQRRQDWLLKGSRYFSLARACAGSAVTGREDVG